MKTVWCVRSKPVHEDHWDMMYWDYWLQSLVPACSCENSGEALRQTHHAEVQVGNADMTGPGSLPKLAKKTQPIETEATLHVMRPWRKWDGNGKSGKTKVQRGSIRWPPRNQGDEPATTRYQRSEQVLWTSVDHLCLTGTSGIGWLSESCCILTNLKSLPNNPLRFLCV